MPHIILPGVNMVQTNYTPLKYLRDFETEIWMIWETKVKEECRMKKKKQPSQIAYKDLTRL